MNKLDVIEPLKRKEEELDNLLKEAGEQVLQIKEDTLRKAKEIRVSMSKEIDRMVDEYKKGEIEKIGKEAEAIKAEAKKQAEELRLRAEKRHEKAVEMVVRYIIEGST